MKISIIEDHDEALKVWRGRKARALDLVHLDAHIDFGVHPARPVESIIKNAGSTREIKEGLEYALSFLQYEKDLRKQTDIGNYIYAAMEEGIVRDLYWVVPGRRREFNKAKKAIRYIFRQIMKQGRAKGAISEGADGVISVKYMGRNFIACSLGDLPVLTQDVLLDIDTDFLITDSVLNAENTKNIGKRKPWIMPQELALELKEKVLSPQITTIAYSVNGGWTPIEYRHLADELACYILPSEFEGRAKKSAQAAGYFKLFNSTGGKRRYWDAVKLNPAYRTEDNNYGPLYLAAGKLSQAKNEFERLLRVDKTNPACLLGLGYVSLERGEFNKARARFRSALRYADNDKLFRQTRDKTLFALAKSEFALKNYSQAKKYLLSYKRRYPLDPESRYFLGIIYEKEGDYRYAAALFKDALRLGLDDIEPLRRLVKICGNFKEKGDIIDFVSNRYGMFKLNFIKFKRLNSDKKSGNNIRKLEKKMTALERWIKQGGE